MIVGVKHIAKPAPGNDKYYLHLNVEECDDDAGTKLSKTLMLPYTKDRLIRFNNAIGKVQLSLVQDDLPENKYTQLTKHFFVIPLVLDKHSVVINLEGLDILSHKIREVL